MSLIKVYNEWDPVEEIIVGSPLYARIPDEDKGFKVIQQTSKDLYVSVQTGPFPDWLIEETEEDEYRSETTESYKLPW
jgi:scyllo-inosamine-4-phosphate amidinotransferase 1